MSKKLFAVVLMSLTLAACESAGTDNSNTNTAKPNTNTAASTPAPVTPSPEPSASVKLQLKAGDKVKVMIGGTATEATVASVDDKAGKVTVKVPAQKEARTVAIADVVKQ
jgi:sRNA-binding protein